MYILYPWLTPIAVGELGLVKGEEVTSLNGITLFKFSKETTDGPMFQILQLEEIVIIVGSWQVLLIMK